MTTAPRQPLTVCSTFAGVGGFDLAFERAGCEVVATAEVDKAARGVLQHHWSDVTHFDDIRKVTADGLRAAGFVPERGVLTAGFPCQDLSVAGRRKGMGVGTRSGLYWELDRLLDEVAPAWFVFENVAGLLSSTCPCTGDGACELDGRGPVRGCPGELHAVTGGACPGGCIPTHGGTMGAVLGSVGNRGYGFAYRVLDARWFGVPQRRRRVAIVGRLGDTGRAPAQVLADFEGSVGNLAPRPEAWTRLAERARGRAREVGVVSALTANMAGAGGGVDDNTAQAGHLVEAVGFSHTAGLDEQARAEQAPAILAGNDRMPAVATFRKAGRAQSDQDDETWTEADVANTVNTFDIGDARATELVVAPITTRNATRTGDDSAGTGIGEPGDVAPTVQTSGATAVGILGDVAHTLTAEGHDAGEDGTGRGTPIIANALTARESKGADSDATTTLIAEPSVRRLTPLECERLQGFPDDWTAVSDGKEQADGPRYKQMGNSLAVPVFEWIAHRVVTIDEAVSA